MNKRIIAAVVIIAFAVAGVGAGALAAAHRGTRNGRASGDADAVTYEPPTGTADKAGEGEPKATEPSTETDAESTEPVTGPETQESEPAAEPEPQPEPYEPEPPKFIWPDESYIGSWAEYIGGAPLLDILSITQDKIVFSVRYPRVWDFHATAIEKDGEIVFGYDVSPDFSISPSFYDSEGLHGKLIFDGDRIIMKYENSFDEDAQLSIYNGSIYYEFDYRTELSEEAIEAALNYLRNSCNFRID